MHAKLVALVRAVSQGKQVLVSRSCCFQASLLKSLKDFSKRNTLVSTTFLPREGPPFVK